MKIEVTELIARWRTRIGHRFFELLVGLSIILGIMLAVRGLVNSLIISFLIGISITIATIIWIYLRHDPSINLHLDVKSNPFPLLILAFSILYALSLLLVNMHPILYERPWSSILLIPALICIVGAEIATHRRSQIPLILVQIILLGLNLAWVQILLFPTVTGSDPWFHQFFTNGMISTQHLLPDTRYTNFPIFHIIIGETALLTDLAYSRAAMVSASLFQILVDVIFVYLVGRFLTRNATVGLLAALLIILAPSHLYLSFWSIPNGLAMALIFPVLLILYRFNLHRQPASALLFILLTGTIILTHTITAFYLAMILFAAWAIFYAARWIPGSDKAPYLPIIVPILYACAMITWWLYDANQFHSFSGFVSNAFSIDYFYSRTPAELLPPTVNSLFYDLINNSGRAFFVFLSVTGIFYLLTRRSNIRANSFAVLGVLPVGIYFLTIALSMAVVQQRLWFFAELFLSVPLALTFALRKTDGPWRSTVVVGVSILLVAGLGFMTLVNDETHVDNGMNLTPSTPPNGITLSEYTASETISSAWSGPIYTDQMYWRSQFYRGIGIDAFNDQVFTRNFTNLRDRPILVRNNILGRTISLYQTTYDPGYRIDQQLLDEGASKMYATTTANAYRFITAKRTP